MYVVLGYLWMSIVTFMHDATHHTLFRRRWLNPAFGIVAMVPVGISFVAFRKDHLEHHRHNRSPRDPDAFTMGRRGVADMVLFYAYMVAGALLSFLHFNVLYPIRSFDRREWAVHLFETALKVAAGVGAGVLGARLRHPGEDAGAVADPDLHLLAVQLRPLHRRALQHAVGSGTAPRHAHDQLEPGARVLLEQHQLAHRAPHLPQGALVQPGRTAPAAEEGYRGSRRRHRQELHRGVPRCAAPRSGDHGPPRGAARHATRDGARRTGSTGNRTPRPWGKADRQNRSDRSERRFAAARALDGFEPDDRENGGEDADRQLPAGDGAFESEQVGGAGNIRRRGEASRARGRRSSRTRDSVAPGSRSGLPVASGWPRSAAGWPRPA